MIPLAASLLVLTLCGWALAVTIRGNWQRIRKAGPWRYWFPR